jgi:hypothetical protein
MKITNIFYRVQVFGSDFWSKLSSKCTVQTRLLHRNFYCVLIYVIFVSALILFERRIRVLESFYFGKYFLSRYAVGNTAARAGSSQ